MPFEQESYDLNALLACAKREVALRERVYPWLISKGKLKEKKAAEELELMRTMVRYFVDAIFRDVTNQPPPPPA